jgi:tRNA A-37 threonylcarbamoyl transferase component Bud32
MAEKELSIPYKPKQLRAIRQTLLFLKWLIVIVLPLMILAWLEALLFLPATAVWRFSSMIFVNFGLATFYALFAAFAFLLLRPFRNDQIRLSQSGFTVPYLAWVGHPLHTNHSWLEVTSASIMNLESEPANRQYLVLSVDKKRPVKLSCDGFTETDLEQLLLAIELWGVNTKRSPDLIEFQTQLQNSNKGLDRLSYTMMWEEELTRRFSSTAFVPLEPGSQLRSGNLTVVKQLAFGGLSAVYLVQEKNCDLRIVKEATVPRSANESLRREAEKHLARESELLAKLRHPRLAQVMDYFIEDGKHYLLLEYIAGQDLRQLVKQHGPQSIEKVLDWAIQMCDVLDFLHNSDPAVIHRDFTPDNLVLKNDGSVVVIDFGASNEFIGTATGTLVGKQAYIAPEQFRGKATCKSDMYALGATLFFLLTGRDPIPLSQSRPSAVLPGIPSELDDLIAVLTQPEPAKRIDGQTTKSKLMEILEKFPDTKGPLSAKSNCNS